MIKSVWDLQKFYRKFKNYFGLISQNEIKPKSNFKLHYINIKNF